MEDERNLALESLLDPPPPPGYEEEPKKTPSPQKRAPLPLFAGVCALILGLGIWIGTGIGKSKPTEPPESEQLQSPPETTTTPESTAPSEPGWEANLLRADPVPYRGVDHWDWKEEAVVFPVFGSEYRREQIASVTFLDTLADAPENAWDVSEAGDGRVMAWVTPANDLYDLCIAAEGGISAAHDCSDLFAGYSNAKTINFGEAFHTTGAADMSRMFFGCKALTELNLNRFDTSAVQDMSWMFSNCYSMTDLTLGDSFDTSAVQDMNHMFYFCESLTELTLGDSFDTSAVQDMSSMFNFCESLTHLTLGDSFDTSAVQDMNHMFYWCAHLRGLTLGDSFDTSAVQDMNRMFCRCKSLTKLTLGDNFVTTNADTEDMFYDCPAGADYRHLLN